MLEIYRVCSRVLLFFNKSCHVLPRWCATTIRRYLLSAGEQVFANQQKCIVKRNSYEDKVTLAFICSVIEISEISENSMNTQENQSDTWIQWWQTNVYENVAFPYCHFVYIIHVYHHDTKCKRDFTDTYPMQIEQSTANVLCTWKQYASPFSEIRECKIMPGLVRNTNAFKLL